MGDPDDWSGLACHPLCCDTEGPTLPLVTSGRQPTLRLHLLRVPPKRGTWTRTRNTSPVFWFYLFSLFGCLVLHLMYAVFIYLFTLNVLFFPLPLFSLSLSLPPPSSSLYHPLLFTTLFRLPSSPPLRRYRESITSHEEVHSPAAGVSSLCFFSPLALYAHG